MRMIFALGNEINSGNINKSYFDGERRNKYKIISLQQLPRPRLKPTLKHKGRPSLAHRRSQSSGRRAGVAWLKVTETASSI